MSDKAMADKTPIQRLMLWDEDRPTLRDIVKFSPEQLRDLSRFIDDCGFEPRFGEALDIAEKLGRSHESVADLLRYLQFLSGQCKQLGLKPENVLEEFRAFGKRQKIKDLDAKLPAIEEALLDLFKDRTGTEGWLRAKKRTVSAGIVPSADSFYSLCSLRPVFNEARDRILDYIPIALVRVRVKRDFSREPEDLVFQIDGARLKEMEDFMKLLRQKFSIIEQDGKKLNKLWEDKK